MSVNIDLTVLAAARPEDDCVEPDDLLSFFDGDGHDDADEADDEPTHTDADRQALAALLPQIDDIAQGAWGAFDVGLDDDVAENPDFYIDALPHPELMDGRRTLGEYSRALWERAVAGEVFIGRGCVPSLREFVADRLDMCGDEYRTDEERAWAQLTRGLEAFCSSRGLNADGPWVLLGNQSLLIDEAGVVVLYHADAPSEPVDYLTNSGVDY